MGSTRAAAMQLALARAPLRYEDIVSPGQPFPQMKRARLRNKKVVEA